MSLSSRNWFRGLAATSAAVVFAVAGGAAALADGLAIDGDGLANPSFATGNPATVVACTDKAIQFEVLIAARRNGEPNNNANNNVFRNGSVVTISPPSGTAGMTAAVADNAITLPSDWRSQGTNFLSPEKVTAVVTLPAQQVAGSGPIAFAYSGVNAVGTAVTGNTQVTVNWTTKSCLTSDTTPPTVTVPSDFIVEAAGPSGTLVTFSASATDAVGPANPAVTCLPASGSTFALGMTTVACSAEDTAGNMGTNTFNVTVVDTTAPQLSVPANITLEATGPHGATATFQASATDAVTAEPEVSCVPASGSTFPLGTSTVNCSATDAAGNKDAGSFTVTVQDTTAPALTLPANMTFEATGPDGATATFQASATDAVTAGPEVSCVPASGSTFALGTTPVNCSAIDAAGNKATGSFTVSVNDTTAPKLALPAGIGAEATGPSGAAVSFNATATDTVGPANPDVTCNPASGSTFALGTTPVNCSATDAAGNTGSGTFTVTVEDTTAPTITWLGGPQDGASYVFGSVPAAGTCTATDVVDTDATCEVTGYGTTVGGHTLTATATDASGNEATETRDYSVAAWTLKGFYSPVDINGVWNTVKNGSTVPLKFELFAGTTELTSTGAVQGFKVDGVSCPGSQATTDDVELTTTGGTSLRYDTTGGQFIQNWQTPKKVGACYAVTMTALDGSTISANFKLK